MGNPLKRSQQKGVGQRTKARGQQWLSVKCAGRSRTRARGVFGMHPNFSASEADSPTTETFDLQPTSTSVGCQRRDHWLTVCSPYRLLRLLTQPRLLLADVVLMARAASLDEAHQREGERAFCLLSISLVLGKEEGGTGVRFMSEAPLFNGSDSHSVDLNLWRRRQGVPAALDHCGSTNEGVWSAFQTGPDIARLSMEFPR